jgi:hypothetical protein
MADSFYKATALQISDDPGLPDRSPPAQGAAMSRSNVLYLIIGALVVVAAVLGYNLYQDRKEPKGLQINLGEKGLSIEKK